VRNILELGLVFRVCLDAQRGCEDELADACAETGEEGVEGLGDELAMVLKASMYADLIFLPGVRGFLLVAGLG
jgi:hypothetical protein